MSKKVKIILLFLSLFILIVSANSVLAQNFGLNEVNNTIALSQSDPRIIIGRIIQIILSFLGVIALILVMYAGFLWMTSGGEEDKVSQAKKILSNAVIGLVIILSSWGIATFILNRLGAAAGVGGGSLDVNSNNGFSNQGIGAIGACSVESFYPADGQKDVPRNTSIIITFKEELKLDSVCSDGSGTPCACNTTNCNKINPEAIRIFKKDLTDACNTGTCLSPNSNVTEVIVNITSSKKTLILTTPASSPLGSPSANTEYSVKFSNSLKKADGTSMFKSCNSDFFQYGFTVNTSLDLTPPIILKNGIFPLPDNFADARRSAPGQSAMATLSLAGSVCPNVYTPAKLISVTSSNATETEIPEITAISEKNINKFFLSVPNNATNTLQIFNDTTKETLGSENFDSNGFVVFPNLFSFKVKNHSAGSSWTVNIQPEIFADTLTIGQNQYTFVSKNDARANLANYIIVPDTCSLEDLTRNIQVKIGNTDITVDRVPATYILNLTVRKIGFSGNNLALNSTVSPTLLKITPFVGGKDAVEQDVPQDKTDQPMNSALQINFNEAINPMTVSGLASEVSSYIRVVNANATSSSDQAVCADNLGYADDSKCKSYNCDPLEKICVGDYLGGKFMVSNQYRTLEFITDRECGVNACGEKIYCFPANSHLSVELMAANLKTCSDNNDCLALGEFNTCSSTQLIDQATQNIYKTCQDKNGKNYPLAQFDKLGKLDGIVDAATNSLDGNRDISSDGPLSFYFENDQAAQNTGKKDKYKWSFYIGNKINLTPPQITFLSHENGKTGVNLADPIQINFDALMLNSSLHTGSSVIQNGSKTITHKLINLSSTSPSPLGYWVSSENQDVKPIDGEPDSTVVKIEHSPFSQSMDFKAQIGSGVKDIYQNCFKPSADNFTDKSCGVSPDKPSCCFGVATSELDSDGNCK